jgi:hypothetical protein
MPKQVVLPVTTFWFNVSEHQAASPYLVCRQSCSIRFNNIYDFLGFY